MAFVVDSSVDIPQLYFARVLQFVKALTRGLDLRGTHVGLIAYGSEAKQAFGLAPLASHVQLDRMVDTASYVGGDLRTGNALLKSKQQLFALSGRQDAPRALVLFSSGSSSDDASLPAAELRDSGVKVTRGNSQVTRGQLAGNSRLTRGKLRSRVPRSLCYLLVPNFWSPGSLQTLTCFALPCFMASTFLACSPFS